MTHQGFGYTVDSCPKSQENTTEAATRLNCSLDVHGRSQYVCVPNEDLTAIVEFCYTKSSIVATYQNGSCIQITKDGFLDQISCTNFTEGCPAEPYKGTDLYKYPACSHLDTKHRCFHADPSCSSYSNASRTAIDDGSVDIGTILGVVLPLLVMVGILIAAFLFWRRRQKLKRSKEIIEWLGDYKVWRTKISHKFFTLSDDEVSVLFCFLCSDSGPPDFNVTEWLYRLNTIRLRVYHKENFVTLEEAQQTLNRMKSTDYLWADEGEMTEDTKDETMYRIALISPDIPFWYISYNTASVYLRSKRYSRKPEEKCVIGYKVSFLILRLQMNILTHVTMEDTDIYDKIYQKLNVSIEIQKDNEDNRNKFLRKLRREGEAVHYRGRSYDSVDHVTWLWRYWFKGRPDIVRSCIGLHPHNDIYIIDNKAYRKSKYHDYSEVDRSILYSLLLCYKNVPVENEEALKLMLSKIRVRYFNILSPSNDIDVEQLHQYVNKTKNGVIDFISDDIRHDVMYDFVTECLVEDSDLEFFLTTASRDLISEYCRSWEYKRSEGERCLYVPDWPPKMYDLFIDKLQLDIITHCTVSDRGIQYRITEKLNVPQEVLQWDINARERFLKNFKQESVKMFRARGMIVGCAGAGKTTLLRKLYGTKTPDKENESAEKRTLLRKIQRKKTDKDSAEPENTFLLKQRQGEEGINGKKPTETTVGLENHEDLFVIEDNMLKDFNTKKANGENQYLDNNIISMTDFAGQGAYYACHQIYLSRRAFYIVVVDMTKNLNEECRLYDTDRHDPTGSLFHSWTYGDYFHFWLQTINTYCNDGITQMDPKDRTAIKDFTAKVNFHPVILVGSHKDQLGGTLQLSGVFYGQLEASLSKEQTLKRLISPYRYFEVECPPKKLSPKQQISIDRVKTCIVETVQKLPHWGEEVPVKWFELEKSLNQKKANGEKVLKWSELKETANTFSIDEDDLNDVLRFLHEIGKIIYFSVDKLKDTIIIDVQWFVDAFKYIITDEKHFARIDNKNPLVNTGKITGQYIEEMWKNIEDNCEVPCADTNVSVETDRHHDSLWQSYLNHKGEILQYMDKLGLMTRIEARVSADNEEPRADDEMEMYYIPSMNRTDLPGDSKEEIRRKKQKSAMMVYFFKSYLPHFFFFRLVVSCLKKWKVCDKNSFFKNAALYKAKEAGHYFAIAVSKTSIQLQVFTRDETVKMDEKCVKKIRQRVEDYIREITETFHRGIIYDEGFSCSDIKITDEDEDFFLKETNIEREFGNSKEITCPKHFRGKNKHTIDTSKIRMCLFERKSTSFSSDN